MMRPNQGRYLNLFEAPYQARPSEMNVQAASFQPRIHPQEPQTDPSPYQDNHRSQYDYNNSGRNNGRHNRNQERHGRYENQGYDHNSQNNRDRRDNQYGNENNNQYSRNNNNYQRQNSNNNEQYKDNNNHSQNNQDVNMNEITLKTHAKQFKRWFLQEEDDDRDLWRSLKTDYKQGNGEEFMAWFESYKNTLNSGDVDDSIIRVGDTVQELKSGRVGQVTSTINDRLVIQFDDNGRSKPSYRLNKFVKVSSGSAAKNEEEQQQPYESQNNDDYSNRKKAATTSNSSEPEVGDIVNAQYEDEGIYPGTVAAVLADRYYGIVFEGFEDYAPYQCHRDAITEILKKAVSNAPVDIVEDQSEQASVEEIEEVYVPILRKRDRIKYQGETCFVKKIEYDNDGNALYGVSRQSDREWISGLRFEDIEYEANFQDKGKAIFAYTQEKRIGQRDFKNELKTFKEWRAFGFDRLCSDRDGNIEDRHGNLVCAFAKQDEDDPEVLLWRDTLQDGSENPLPTIAEVAWFCPERAPITIGSLCKVEENGETHTGRVREYDFETKLFKLSFKDRDSGETTEFEYPFDRLTVKLTRKEQIKKIFACYGKSRMRVRLFEGYFRTLFPDGGRPPDETYCEETGIVEADEGYYLLVDTDLPPIPEDCPEEFPKYFERDTILIDGAKIPDNPIPWRTVRGFIRQVNGTTALVSYNQPQEDREADRIECEAEFDFADFQLFYKLDEKIEIIFSGYQKKTITKEELILCLRLLFKDEVKDPKRMMENCTSATYDKDKCVWDEDLPPRDPTLVVPRIYRANSKVEVNIDGRWMAGSTIRCTDEKNGEYDVEYKSRGEMVEGTVSCLQLRPQIVFWDKVRACFAEAQQETLTGDEVNEKMMELFGDYFNDFSKVEEILEIRAQIYYDSTEETLKIEKLPPKNLMQIWSQYRDLPFKKKIDAIFKQLGEKVLTFDQLNDALRRLFDDHVEEVSETIGKNPFYVVDDNVKTIECKVQDLTRLKGLDECDLGNDAAEWGLIFETMNKDWEKIDRDTLVQFGKSELLQTPAQLAAIEEYLKTNNISFDGAKPWPRPGDNFQDCFSIYSKNEEIASFVDNFVRKLEAVFDEPTMVQRCCWPALALSQRDILGISKTGSGKTLAFAIPVMLHCLLQRMAYGEPEPGICTALILVPTHELAHQHAEVFEEYSEILDTQNFKISKCIGGEPKGKQLNELEEGGIDVIIATVGRLLDVLSTQHLDLRNTSMIVLDEADEMLNGFENEVREVLTNQVRPALERKSVLFSATFSEEVLKIEHAFFQNNPLRVTVGLNTVKADPNIIQKFAYVDRFGCKDALLATLKYIQKNEPSAHILVFVNSKNDAVRYTQDVEEAGFSVTSVHGDLMEEDRKNNLINFKSKRKNVLIGTDVMARGIDISELTVIQIGFPVNHESVTMAKETYIHRIGRAARAGAKGISYVIEETGREKAFDIAEVLNDVGQFGPPSTYSVVPAEAEDIPDFPVWAGGLDGFDEAIKLYADNFWSTQAFDGHYDGFAQAIRYFYPEDVAGSDAEFNKTSRTHADALAFGQSVLGVGLCILGVLVDEDGNYKVDVIEGDIDCDVRLLWCPDNHPTGAITQNHYRAIFLTPEEEESNVNYVEQRNAPSGQNWTDQQCNIYYEEDGQTYPGFCSHDDGENATVTFNDFADQEYTVASSCLSALGDKVLMKLDESDSKTGHKVNIKYDGEWYPGTVIDDYGNGSYSVQYEDETFGTAQVEEEELEFLAAPVAEASGESWANCRVLAVFEADQQKYEGWVGAEQNADGTWPVYFDAEPTVAYNVTEANMEVISE